MWRIDALERDRVVEVLRVVRVDGEHGQSAQVAIALRKRALDVDLGMRRLFQRSGRKLRFQLVARNHHFRIQAHVLFAP